MKGIPRTRKLEVVQYYILGYPYSDIENRSGVSHGSVVNIVTEYGKLTIPGTSFDQTNDLRKLSSALRKEKLEPAQALLGVLLFVRLQALEITPDLMDKWSKLAKRILPADFPAKDFLEGALRLDELERTEDKPFDTLAVEYERLQEHVARLKSEVDSLINNKEQLTKTAEPLRKELESLERTKSKLENAVELQAGRLNELKSKTNEAEEERSRLNKETEDLRKRRRKLSSEVDGKEESLRRLNDIGLSYEDLLRVTDFVERTSKNQGISGNELKKRFLSPLGLFEDITGLENRRKAGMQQLGELTKKESSLKGEIAELTRSKGLLQREIVSMISSTSHSIRVMGEDAASQIHQQVADIMGQLSTLLVADALKAGEAIGEMRQALKRGEESEKTLSTFIEEVQSKLGRNSCQIIDGPGP